MHITIVTIGSRGDVQPCVALGAGLIAAGHQVRICTQRDFETFITEHGIEYAPLAGDARALMEQLMNSGEDPVKFLRLWYDFFIPVWEQAERDIEQALDGTDLVMYTLFGLPAYHVAEARGLPVIRLALQPFERTGDYPTPMFPVHLPESLRAFNRFTQVFYDYALHLGFRGKFNEWRVRLGLSPSGLRPIYRELHGEPLPLLYGFSPTVIAPASDHGDHVHVTGYWFLERDDDWQPSPDLLDFLEAGEPPVYIGFGSLRADDFHELAALILDALKQTGQRGLLLTGWGGLSSDDLPETVYKLDAAPHDWLFPRMRAIVHHGGAGTTAAALRSGVPSLIVPFFGDQPFWGKRVSAIGAGPDPIPRQELSADRLAQAIQRMVYDLPLRDRAAAIGAAIQQEDGVQAAVTLIERYAEQ